jgi:hypothetical protein
MKKRSYALANEYARKVKGAKAKLKYIEILLNGKYDERLIQQRNILLTNIKTYESLSCVGCTQYKK